MGMLSAIALGAALAALAAWAWSRGRRRAAGVPRATPAGLPRDLSGGDAAEADEAATSSSWAVALVAMAWDDARAGDAGPDADGALQAAVARALDRFSAEPRRLPRRPHLLPQLLAALGDEGGGARDVAAVIVQDPTLAANVLRLANSARYRVRADPVDGIERAVALVGTQGIRQVASVALMQPVVPADGGVLGRLPSALWEFTQDAARAAAAIAPTRGVDAFAAQLLALLHGLGAQVTLQAVREHLEHAGAPTPGVAETAVLLEHWAPRIARLVAREWGLSERVIEALEEHPPVRAQGLRRVLAVALQRATDAGAEPTTAMQPTVVEPA